MFKKTLKQEEATRLLASNSLHSMLYGGSRSGKTLSIIRAIIIRACKEKSRHISLRRYFNSIKTSIWLDTIPKVMSLCFPELKYKMNSSDYYITFPNGSEYWIGGLDDDARVEKILGKEFSSVHFNECSELSYSSVQKAITRLAEKNNLKKKAYYDQNPPRKNHWTYLQFEKGLDPINNIPLVNHNDFNSLLMNPEDNKENIDENYLNILMSLPENEKDRFLLGKYTDVDDGMVYYNFNREAHVKNVKRYPGSILIGMDFNVDPMTAVIAQYIDNKFNIIDEVYLKNSDTYKMCSELIKRQSIGDIYPDSTGRNRKTSGASDFDILNSQGFKVMDTRNPFVTDRVNNINRLLQDNRIVIDPKCKKLINDLEKVAWKNNSLDQKTDKSLTHISDALGYLCWAIDPIEGLTDNRLIVRRI